MNTEIIRIDQKNIDKSDIERAAEYIRRGELVAFPTETVYGLGGDATDGSASKKIYAAKGRPSDNPLIVHIADKKSLYKVGIDIPENAKKLAEAFWPGPMTLIVKKSKKIPCETTGGLDTVAVRLPSHPIARALIQASGCYIAAPSANKSGRPSPTRAAHVIEDLSGKVACIIDGGPVDIGLESTIIDLTTDVPAILRPGAISLSDVEAVTGTAQMDPGLFAESDERPRAPGMRYRHYAPRGELTIVEGDRQSVTEKIIDCCTYCNDHDRVAAVIAGSESAGAYRGRGFLVYDIGEREHEDEIAKNLYDILRQLDSDGVEYIYSESFEGPDIGVAIMNRLLKAAGHRVIQA